MANEISDDFRVAMANGVEVKTLLTEARKDMKVLNDREKKLKEFVKNYMKTKNLIMSILKKVKFL